VFVAVRWVFGLLVILAGCSTPPRSNMAERPPDWEEPGLSSASLDFPLSVVPVLSVPLPTPPPPPLREDAVWMPLARWSAERGLDTPRCLSVAPVATYGLTTGQGVFAVQMGSQAAFWDGVDVRLGFAPQLIDGQVWMHALDLRKNLAPLVSGGDGIPRRPGVIVLDPGHGGANPGARSCFNGAWEKDYTLDWALRLCALLANQGWQVWLTRTNDTDVPLADRVALADQCQADLFLSLHFNAAGGGRHQAGLETYCLTPVGMGSHITRNYEDDATQVFPNNAFDEQNLQLAVRVHRALLNATGQTDRGVRRARFLAVLRGQQRPAVLVEGGYLSNPAEARRIADGNFRQQLAGAVAGALQ